MGTNLDWLDTYRKKDIICPHCDHEFQDSWEFIETDLDKINCESCGAAFYLQVETEVKYTTSKENIL